MEAVHLQGFNRSSATIASPTSSPGGLCEWNTGQFQSLKRDNCLSNRHSVAPYPLLPHVSIAQARQLPLQHATRLVGSPASGVSIAQARQLPLQLPCILRAILHHGIEFQSLKRDNCLSNPIISCIPTSSIESFNRSSATIASPTDTIWHNSSLDYLFQSLKRDNCLSNSLHCIAHTLI